MKFTQVRFLELGLMFCQLSLNLWHGFLLKCHKKKISMILGDLPEMNRTVQWVQTPPSTDVLKQKTRVSQWWLVCSVHLVCIWCSVKTTWWSVGILSLWVENWIQDARILTEKLCDNFNIIQWLIIHYA